jgi:hypothetical protein
MSVKRSSTIILNGGLFRIFNPAEPSIIKLKPFNILLKKSDSWINGVLSLSGGGLCKQPFYRMTAKRDNRIEVKAIGTLGDQHHLLLVNNTIIWETNDQFNYTIDVKLNPLVKNKPYADFFRYY